MDVHTPEPREPDEPLDAMVAGAVPPATTARALGGAGVVAAAMGAANALAYLLNMVAPRVLGPVGFGALGALLGLVLIGNVVALGLQTVTARVLAHGGAADDAAALYRLGLVSAVAIAGITAVAEPVLASALHLSHGPAIWLLALVLAPLTVTGVQLGLAQGFERFGALALLYITAAGGKVLGGLVGLLAGDSVTSTMTGVAAGATLAAAFGHLVVRDLAGATAPGSTRRHLPELVLATHALLVLFVLTNVDVLLARHFLDGPAAGRYAVGAVVAKAAFWLPGFVAVVALPALSDTARRRRTAGRAVAAVSACGAVVTLGCALLGDQVVRLVGGDAYASLSPEMWLFAATGSMFALAQLLLYSRLAATDRRALAAVWGSLGLLLALVLTVAHDTTGEMITAVLGSAVVLVGVGLLAEAAEHRPLPASGRRPA